MCAGLSVISFCAVAERIKAGLKVSTLAVTSLRLTRSSGKKKAESEKQTGGEGDGDGDRSRVCLLVLARCRPDEDG